MCETSFLTEVNDKVSVLWHDAVWFGTAIRVESSTETWVRPGENQITQGGDVIDFFLSSILIVDKMKLRPALISIRIGSVADCCDDGNEHVGSIKIKDFFGRPINCQNF